MTQRADLDSLKRLIGSQTQKDDAILSTCLHAAGTWVYDRVMAQYAQKPEVVQAILMYATRLYKRRQSPEGLASSVFDSEVAARILSRDPDIERLLEQYLDAAKVWGIA